MNVPAYHHGEADDTKADEEAEGDVGKDNEGEGVVGFHFFALVVLGDLGWAWFRRLLVQVSLELNSSRRAA